MTSEERVQALIKRGIMPTEAERIVLLNDDEDQEMVDVLTSVLATVWTERKLEADELWIMWTPDIPNAYRRMWTARQ